MKPTEIADGVREGMETEREPVAEKWVLIDEDAELPENPYKKTFYFNYVRITEAEIAERLYEAYEKGQQSVIDAGFRKVREEDRTEGITARCAGPTAQDLGAITSEEELRIEEEEETELDRKEWERQQSEGG